MSSRSQGRHRSAVRPRTPLSTISTNVQAASETVGRRGAVIAASSGLVMSLGVTAADASTLDDETGGDAATETVDLAAAQAAIPARVPLAVAAGASTPKVGAVALKLIAPPKPKVVQAPAPDRSSAAAATSRSGSRGSTAPKESTAKPETTEPAGSLSATRANIMSVAARYVGTKYVYGGTTPSGFDCSGYLQYVFKQVGISLPRTSSAQAGAAVRISRSEAKPGDLVYKPGHIGIYAGGNMMYDSPRTGKSVSKREIFSSSFGFYRVLND